MAIEVAELDAMQAAYHEAVEEWVRTIREEFFSFQDLSCRTGALRGRRPLRGV